MDNKMAARAEIMDALAHIFVRGLARRQKERWRLLQYAGNLYEKYVKENKLNKYGSELLRLPVPKLVVFYNGTIDQPDEKTLRLSESFPEDADADIEVKVRMLNVNVGRNKELLDACKPLGEYSWLVDEVRRNNTTKDEEGMSSAIDKAISSMPDDYVIKPFLEAHRAEVKGMLLTEYNEAEQMELFKEDGRRESRFHLREIHDRYSLLPQKVTLIRDQRGICSAAGVF